MRYTIEEIMLIKSCNTKDKDRAIQILGSYIGVVDYEMAKLIRNMITNLKEQSQEEYLEAADYPI